MLHVLATKKDYQSVFVPRLSPETNQGPQGLDFYGKLLGWLMGLEPTTTGITILDSTN